MNADELSRSYSSWTWPTFLTTELNIELNIRKLYQNSGCKKVYLSGAYVFTTAYFINKMWIIVL